MGDMLKRLCDAAEAYLETSAEKGHQYFLTREKRQELRQCARDAREAQGVWPASKMPTCPKCGWPPMVDAENATEDDPAPIVCAC